MITFVVLSWNGGDEVVRCVESVMAQRGAEIEIIVVDNGSTDDSVDRLHVFGEGVRLLRNPVNVGFAAGMNQGMRIARGDIIVPTNQDVVLASDFAVEVRRIFDSDPSIGSVGGVVRRLAENGPSDEFDAGGYFLRHRLAAGSGLIGPIESGEVDVFGVSGCCPAFRADMLRDIELVPGEYYDSSYFAYFEDIDLFFRAQLRGWRAVYAASVRAWHCRSSSSGGSRRFFEKPPWIQEHHFRNRYSTLVKNCPTSLAIKMLPAVLVTELLLLPYLLVRSPRSLGPLGRAWRGFAHSLPRLWSLRRRIQGNRRAPDARLAALVRGF